MREGDLVEIAVLNVNIDEGVSIHWHGVDVPNAEDGVSGVTQDAVLPGQRYTYRFKVHQSGTFWYHSHQASSRQVKRGLYGAFVILPRGSLPRTLDLAVVAHSFSGARTLGAHDGIDRRAAAPGTPVRLRVINSDSFSRRFVLSGTRFRVAAVDGTELNQPGLIEGKTLELAGGGRYDLTFTMPTRTVQLHWLGARAALALSPDGRGALPEADAGQKFDPADYGSPARTRFDASSDFDRAFMVKIEKRFGFLDGRFGRHWAVNGKLPPEFPTHIVSEGDVVKMTFVNDTDEDHPMHLHGHHMLVLTRDGEPVTGSPWWSDTLNVKPGERYEVAFRADNPGLWMDHCHNLGHAADGLVLHLAYEGVATPFMVGTRNRPE
ncbi:MAG: multicopper oxidase family protein [Actinobacteria bacterium]|nr:multicopper oxidase family protein [Actinomycetota bacterium]